MNKTISFDPGFRISLTDAVFLMVMMVAAAATFHFYGSVGYFLVAPVIQFFLFCNVFRIRRVAELIWAALFLAGSMAMSAREIEPFYCMVAGLLLGAVVIGYELLHPSYHGIFWKRVNPDLQTWFDANVGKGSGR